MELYRVHLAIEQQRDVVCKLFDLVWFVFLEAAPIPYCRLWLLSVCAYNTRLQPTTVYVFNKVVHLYRCKSTPIIDRDLFMVQL